MERLKKTTNNRKGFTLVELVATLVILAILLAAGITGILSYQKYANFKRNNEYAKTIYTAAQSALTHYKASGELEKLEEELGQVYLGSADEYVVPRSVVGSDLYGRIRFMNNNDGSSCEQWLRDLLEPYLTDASLWNGAINLEFDVQDGVVYSACYSDQADSFTYTGTPGTVSGGVMNIVERDTTTRQNICLGYYESETMPEKSPASYGKASLSRVELQNGETLDLRWWLSGSVRSYTQTLKYDVRLYNERNEMICYFEIDGNQLQVASAGDNPQVELDVYDSNNLQISGESMNFRAYVTSDSMVYVTLDGLDLEANETTTDFTNTYSINRILPDKTQTGKIYARVQAGGSNFKSSGWVGSTATDPYMANSDGDKLTVANARHLYNLRYYEEESQHSYAHTYEQTADIDWAGETGILSNLKVYEHGTTVTDQETKFPAMTQLNTGSVYGSSQNRTYTISNLTLESAETESAPEDGTDTEQALGLFCINRGTIENITLENVQIAAAQMDHVGAFCGINYGSLQNLTTKGGTVYGHSYIGGIFGALANESGSTQTRTISNLENQAEVYGVSYIGGIAGAMEVTSAEQLEISGCENTGAVYGTANVQSQDGVTPAQEAVRFVGGITGYGSNVTLNQCVSTPNYDTYTAEQLAEKAANLEGQCVGGIAGYLSDATLTQCSTGGGYVFGDTYVGGIVGLNASTGTQSNGLNGDGQANRAQVTGNSYVGGIVGANTRITGNIETGFTVETDRVTGEDLLIDNWSNQGVVTAKVAYAGGITGYNTGTIRNCDSTIDVSAVSGEVQLQQAIARGTDGDYIGGMVGYNNGALISNSARQSICVVAGHNYVGGIVGYNDVDAAIQNYNLRGGYLQGHNFVGGVAGFNASRYFFTLTGAPNQVTSGPNKLDGDYYVGGIIGANVVGTSTDIEFQCNTNNFLSQVTASQAFVGGYIGYNQLLSETTHEASLAVANQLIAATEYSSLTQVVETVDEIHRNSTGASLIIAGDNQSTAGSNNELNRIRGRVYVGGIVGYNNEDSKLFIANVINQTIVQATDAITSIKEYGSRNDYNGNEKTYSYAGGMIGKASKNVTIHNCRNAGLGEVISTGTYTGGLVEINEGRIEYCTSASMGDAQKDYVGGIAGINLNNIVGCQGSGNVIGRSYVGGITAENYGRICRAENDISMLTQAGNVTGYGRNVGGVAGYNSSTGTISDILLTGSVTGEGTNVGGIAGTNAGTVSNVQIQTLAVSVIGNSNVGGFVGLQQNGTLAGLTNYATVRAQAGNAGGIAGAMEGANANMTDCHNIGPVTAVRSGNAGGITSSNEGTISACTVSTGAIVANYGNVGGITADNRGTISGCTVGTSNRANLTFTGYAYAGGIAARNLSGASITGSNVINIIVRNQDAAGISYVGGIAGSNEARISTSGTTGTSVMVHTRGSYGGGVAGYNSGTIAGTDSNRTSVSGGTVGFGGNSSNTLVGYLGGIAGRNHGTIAQYAFSGTITGNGGASYGYGGITGVNVGNIEFCTVAGSIQAAGTNEDMANLGGVAGQNNVGATIRNITFNSITLGSASTRASVGGAAGRNYGTVANCGNENSNSTVTMESYGNIGGMVGYNGVRGAVNNCVTGNKWIVQQYGAISDLAVGGIIGYNNSGLDQTDLTNYGQVLKWDGSTGNSAGGIIGRQEVTSSSSWVIRNCNNYADVKGQKRVGGLIGQWKYEGGTLENCANYATVESADEGAGGFVGYMFAINSGSNVSFNNCVNYGTITCKNRPNWVSGGVSRTAGGSGRFSLSFTDCVNVGLIKSSDNVGGLLSESTTASQVTFLRCRNYGQSTGNRFSGLAYGGGTANVAYYITDCFGVATATYPLISNAPSDVTLSGSYHMAENEQPEEGIRYDSIEAPEGQSGYSIDKLADGNTTGSNSRYAFEKTASASGTLWDSPETITINLGKDETLENMEVFWYKSAKRYYNFNILYRDAQGNMVSYSDTSYTVEIEKDMNWKLQFDQPITTDCIALQVNWSANTINAAGQPATYNRFFSIYEIKFNGSYLRSMPADMPLNVTQEADQTWSARALYGRMVIDQMKQNPLTVDRTSEGLIRQAIYEDVDPKILAYYNDKYNGAYKLSAPTDLQLTSADGGYNITWKTTDNPYYVRLVVEIYSDQQCTDLVDSREISVWSGSSTFVNVDNSWIGSYMKVTAQSMAFQDEDLNSEIVQGELEFIDTIMPTPEIHMEVVAGTNGYIYKPVLDNIDNYDNFTDVVIKVSIDNANARTITLEQFRNGQQPTFAGLASQSDSSSVITAQASGNTAEGKQRTSIRYTVQTSFLRESFMKSTAMFTDDSSKSGFKGSTAEELTYVLNLKGLLRVNYARVEILAPVAELGIPVAVNSVAVQMSDGSTDVTLSDLAEEVKTQAIQNPTNLTVRAYAWYGQENFIRYVTTVVEGLNAQEVLDSSYVQKDSTGKAIGVANGYTIERTAIDESGAGTYTVYQSQFLDPTAAYGTKQIVPADGTLQTLETTEQPVIGNLEVDGTVDTFRWDESSNKTGPYMVTLIGYPLNEDGTEVLGAGVQLYHEESTTDKVLTIDSAGWKYGKLQLSVTRIGTVDSSGFTRKLGMPTIAQYGVKISLDSIGVPSVTINSSDNLTYTVSWTGIASSNQQQYGALGGYTVYAVSQDQTITRTVDKSVTEISDLDLDAFEGKAVQVYVVANAKADSQYFQDSAAGTARTVQVPDRLPLPELDQVTLSAAYDQVVKAADFVGSGMTLTVTSDAAVGNYTVRAGIYDSPQTDGTGTPAGNLLQDLTGENGQPMTGTAASATYQIRPASTDYAGKYLFVQFRTSDVSSVASKWSAYKYFRLPKVQLNTPDLSPVLATQDVTATIGDSGREYLILKQHAIDWNLDKDAKGYEVHLQTLNAGSKLAAGYDYPITLTSDQDGYLATVPDLEATISNTTKSYRLVLDTDNMEQNLYIYTTDLPDYSWTFTGNLNDATAASYSYTLTAKAQVLIRTNNTGEVVSTTWRLILPDIWSVDTDTYQLVGADNVMLTNQATVRALEADSQNYAQSLRRRWFRQTMGSSYEVRTEEVADEWTWQ